MNFNGRKTTGRLLAAVLAAALFCACGAGAAPAAAQGQGGRADGAAARVNTISVNIIYPTTETLQRETEFVGKIEASQSVKVYPEVSGTVANTYFNAGDVVQQGQLLFDLDDEDAASTLRNAELNYQKTLADIASEESGSSKARTELEYQTNIQTATNNYETARANLEAATGDDFDFSSFKRARTKLKDAEKAYDADESTDNWAAYIAALDTYNDLMDDYASYSNYQNLITSFENAYDTYLRRLDEYEIYKSITSTEEAASREISREQAEITLENAQKSFNNHKVYAPVTGVIAAKNISAYDVVSQNTSAYTISQEGVQCVTFNLSEDAVDAMEIGYEVTVNYNGKEYTAQVTELSPEADSSTGLYAAKAQLSEELGTSRSGAVIKVTAITAEEKNALTVPIDYVYYDGNQPYVYIYENDTAKRVDVTLGMSTYETVSITSGLSANDAVISTWHPNLKDGAAVHNDELSGESESADAYAPDAAPEKKEG